MWSFDHMLAAQFSLVLLKVKTGRRFLRPSLRLLHDEWGYAPLAIAKRNGDDPKTPGDHGDPEIARQEKAFYDALTAGQKAAYKAVQELVYQLYNANQAWEGIDPWKIDEPLDAWKANAFYELATHPQRAYMLGQMLASEALKEPLHRPLMPTDGRAINFLQATTFNEIDSSFEHLKGKLRRALIDGMTTGENPREVARKLANELNDHTTQWDVVAITETSRAESTGRLQEFADADIDLTIGSSAHDSKACDDCLRLIDGKIYRVADIQGVTNYGVKRANWKACIPCHPSCRCSWLPYVKGDPLDVTDDSRSPMEYGRARRG